MLRNLLRQFGPTGATALLTVAAVLLCVLLLVLVNLLVLQRPVGRSLPVLALVAAVALPLALYPTLRLYARLLFAESQLARLGSLDPETGFFGRQRLMQELERELQRAQRYGGELSLLSLGLRWRIEDGQERGRWLARMVKHLREHTRGIDVCARLDEEVFAFVLPGTGKLGAARVAERLRRELAAIGPSNGDGVVALEVGISSFDTPTADAHQLLHRSEEALALARETAAGVAQR